MVDHWPTILIAAIAAIIAFQQWRTAYDKLRFDLYARRLSVYDAAMDFLEIGIRMGELHRADDVQVRKNFVRAWREARFLFGKNSKVYSILSEMHMHVIIATTHTDPAIVLYQTEHHKRLLERQYTAVNWIAVAGDQLSDAMEPFLDFRRLQNLGLEELE